MEKIWIRWPVKFLIFLYDLVFWVFDKTIENFKRVQLWSLTFLFCHFIISVAIKEDDIIRDLRTYMHIFFGIVFTGAIVNTFVKAYFPEHWDYNHIIGSIPYGMLVVLMSLAYLVILPGTAPYA